MNKVDSVLLQFFPFHTDMLTTQLPVEARRKSNLKIIRVFSKGIERKEFPGPLLNDDSTICKLMLNASHIIYHLHCSTL